MATRLLSAAFNAAQWADIRMCHWPLSVLVSGLTQPLEWEQMGALLYPCSAIIKIIMMIVMCEHGMCSRV